ncbi:UMP-CMP kinase [Clavulina sp. PMI_390]|nr:UMP-CMP kinase [Clavulina sp. PMI_390]
MPVLEKLQNVFKHKETAPAAEGSSSSTNANPAPPPTTTDMSTPASPVFDHKKITVIYVLGGPGAGKGTQCALLVKDYDFVHLSAGDLLRAEQERAGSQYGELIKDYIKEGKIVPMEVTIKLLENAMTAAIEERKESTHPGWQNGKGRFLIDGFPRKMDQAIKFDESVCLASFVLFYVCPENVLLERLLERGKTSGRSDDNEESIKKRFRTFIDTSMPVIDYYRARGKVVEIDSSPSVDAVQRTTKAAMDAAFAVSSKTDE